MRKNWLVLVLTLAACGVLLTGWMCFGGDQGPGGDHRPRGGRGRGH
jgi:hypothetical protein